ncbi:MAG: hypothetical protein OXH85_07485 [Truepera sp.]|nr:hypothetical protein [Truepera sp.]
MNSMHPRRRCRSCGTDITLRHHNAIRCERCAAAARAASKRRYQLRVWTDPAWRAREAERARVRYATEPEHRERRQTRARVAMQELRDRPGWREDRSAKDRARYAADPDYRAKRLESSRASYRRAARAAAERGGAP